MHELHEGLRPSHLTRRALPEEDDVKDVNSWNEPRRGEEGEKGRRDTDKQGKLNLSVKVSRLSLSLCGLHHHLEFVLLLVKLKEELSKKFGGKNEFT